MNDNIEETRYNFKGFFKYISTVVSWTVFVLLMIIAILLIYYYISMKLYTIKGEKYEPAFSIYTIVSGSMEPTISVMDSIVNFKIKDANDVEINDVITFISTWKVNYGMTVTHRVVGIDTLDDGSRCFITRGDNVPQPDEGCVKEQNVIGVVKAVIPGLGNLQTFLSSRFGWLLLVIIPALYIIIKDIFKIFGLMKEEKKEKEGNQGKTMELPNLKDTPIDSKDEKAKLKEAYADIKKIQNKSKKKK